MAARDVRLLSLLLLAISLYKLVNYTKMLDNTVQLRKINDNEQLLLTSGDTSASNWVVKQET